MSTISRSDDRVSFWCPGCDDRHTINVSAGGWTFDGNVNAPTFAPSVLVTSGHFIVGREEKPCWCSYNAEQIAKGEEPSSFKCRRCHSFVNGGLIQFLGDCSHAMANTTVPLPPFPTEDQPE